MRFLQRSLRPVYAPLLHPKHTARIQLSNATPLPAWTRSFHASASWRALDLAYRLHDHNGDAKGDPIVIIHGLFGSKRNNQSVANAFARILSRPVYAIDTRNHGESPHDTTHNYTALADDVEAFLKKHDLKNATLIGHSMGAKTVMTLALRNPDSCANIIPVDNAPVDAALSSDFPKYAEGMKRVEQAKPKSQKEADKILEPYAKDLPVRQFLLTNLGRPEPSAPLKFRIPIQTLARSLDDMADFPFTNPDEVRFSKRALFIRGTKSPYVSDETLPIIGRFFPRFELVDIDSGHWVISEKPEEFIKAVVNFLQEKE
ncbi:alpha/beta-hydrolase [Cucurbitaria berberidis CBS 394.84]|uniref:Alpha/beta-hydrolase n=1 Tax=Cucurbitaria berberidis CBS 394.84 TaxID=1168544 RepID=A0A9P4GTZ6_9PLEO|nr:alpha/beta-hydrolase [Cucurbitaria berberidis CBS 394.84]KAF1851021.1 alpha/beta-hydrolase [Cucurbitaria berberidis CBS 394.84]